MNRPAKPATVRFYVDADVLGLAKILVQIRPDVTYPGDPGGIVKGRRMRPPCPITDPSTPDNAWIPETARRQWLIITRDRRIQDHHAEIEAVRSSGARMVNLSGAEALDTFHQMEALMCQWQKVHALLDEPGPFIYSLTRTTLRRLALH
jgi:PIN domain-containing protein